MSTLLWQLLTIGHGKISLNVRDGVFKLSPCHCFYAMPHSPYTDSPLFQSGLFDSHDVYVFISLVNL